jgi:hypothetical protein
MISETSYRKKPTQGGLFDPEDEDNMVDQAESDKDLQENFVNVNVLKQEINRVVEADSDNEETDEIKVRCKVLAAKVELGLLEAEVTDFTVKKVIDILVTDFPMSAGRAVPKQEDTARDKTDCEGKCLEYNDVLVQSDGLHCKLRLHSQEVSHLKVIGLRGIIAKTPSMSLATLRLDDF